MNTAVKVIIGVAVAGCVVGAAAYTYSFAMLHNGVDYEQEYKELLDATFEGNYTMTVTDSGKYYNNSNSLFRIPIKYKMYDVKYNDVNGNERHFKMSESDIYSGRSLIDCCKDKKAIADSEMVFELADESQQLFYDQIGELLKKYYGDDLEQGGLKYRYTGDGFDIELISVNVGYNLYQWDDKVKIIPSGARGVIDTLSSPDTCNVLTKQDLDSYANMKTCGVQFVVSVTDKDNAEKKVKKLKKQTEAFLEEYASLSEFGGNYSYIIGTKEDPDDNSPDEELYKKYVVAGEEKTPEYYSYYDFEEDIDVYNGINRGI